MTDWAGNERSSTVFHVDYGKVEQIVATLSDRLGASRPDAVVGIVRAGVVPATMFAQRLGAELHLLRLQRHRRQCEWLGSAPPAGAKVLLVDDIVSRGSTMHRAHAMLVDQGYVVRTAALYVDRRRAEFTPDCALDAPGFIRFSWDRRETTPEARALIASDTEALPPQRETESFGVDMDGVLLPDIRKPHYRKNLALSLSRRQRLAPFTNQALPAIDWQRAHIVTGRPQDDFEATREWLDRHGFENCPLHCRDPRAHDASSQGATAHKIATLTRIGVSTFIESELIQAALIAKACPTVDVIWWGKRHRLRLGGVAPPSFDPSGLDPDSA